ncbi:MAG: deoxyribonuclease IV [Candidatus Micrarchaeota archaeon]|nr:deoxyribonuclease IV [Candidatus Micrarchaeota archaeon]
MLRIGYHVSIAKGLDLAFDRAKAVGCTAMQLFVSNPRGWSVDRPGAAVEKAFSAKRREFDIVPVAHMPYLPNLASSNPMISSRSILSLRSNLSSCNSLGIGYLVAHLGSHMGNGKEKGISNIIDALDRVADDVGSVRILLENQAGHRNSIGADLNDLSEIHDRASIARAGKLGFCLDTCHLFAAGYDIRKADAIDVIKKDIGLNLVHVLHMNDAKFELGSGKDRHENIGFGLIGREGFRVFLANGEIRKKVLILETPANAELKPGYELRILKGMA